MSVSKPPKPGQPESTKTRGVARDAGLAPVAVEGAMTALSALASLEGKAGKPVAHEFALVNNPALLSVQAAARTLSEALLVKRRDENDPCTEFVIVKDGTPAWVVTVVQNVHDKVLDEPFSNHRDCVMEALAQTTNRIWESYPDKLDGCMKEVEPDYVPGVLYDWILDCPDGEERVSAAVVGFFKERRRPEPFRLGEAVANAQIKFRQEVGASLLANLRGVCAGDSYEGLLPPLKAFELLRKLVEKDPSVTGLAFEQRPCGGSDGGGFTTFTLVARGDHRNSVLCDEAVLGLKRCGVEPFLKVTEEILCEGVHGGTAVKLLLGFDGALEVQGE